MAKKQRAWLLAGAILLPLIGAFIVDATTGNRLGWIVGLSLVGGGIFALLKLNRLIYGEPNKEAQVLRQINDKKVELARHQQIVQS